MGEGGVYIKSETKEERWVPYSSQMIVCTKGYSHWGD